MPCKWSGDSPATKRGNEPSDRQQLAWRLENLEEKIDKLTDLCYRGLGDPCKRPAPRRYARCPWPWADSPKNESAASTSLSDADQKILGDVDRHMLIGELLFQFERRVFSAVIPKIRRFYGYAVRNIEQLIAREEEVADRVQFRCNLSRLNERLRPLGYLPYYHSELSCSIINEYGVLARSAAEIRTMSHKLEDVPFLKRLISVTLPLTLRDDVLKLFDCLVNLCDEDGGKIFCY